MSRATVLVEDPEGRVLVDRAGGLPGVELGSAWVPWNADLCDAVREQLGVHTRVLEPLDEVSVALVTDEPGTPSAGLRWADPASVDSAVAQDWCRRRDPDVAPWCRRGWWAGAIEWARGVLESTGRTVTGPPRQVQHWSLSCVVRIPAGDSEVFLKATRPEWGREPGVISQLGARLPGRVPHIIAVDEQQHRWLAEDFGGEPLSGAGVTERARAAGRWGEVQRALAGSAPSAAPVEDVEDLAAAAPALLARADLFTTPGRAGPAGELDGAARRRAMAHALYLQDLCADLTESAVPVTLVHGDLHVDNVAVVGAGGDDGGGGFVYYDLGFASVSHPFLDLASWTSQDDPRDAAIQVAAYLQSWRGVAPMHELQQDWEAARRVGHLRELLKILAIIDAVGDRCAWQFWPMAYRWAGRLVADE